MTKENIAKNLANNPKFSNVELEKTFDKNHNKLSSWSNSFTLIGNDELNTISTIFGIKKTNELEQLFRSATNGDGGELSKIVTLHSSSLLAFLCFCNVCEYPIVIDGTKYDEVMFEVKNDVIDASLGRPSNIDVLLLGENRTKLLFLESKFTEYLDGDRAELSPKRYERFYQILSKKTELPFVASYLPVTHKPDKNHKEPFITKEYCLNNDTKPKDYLDGIKQAFSHLLGIATGPASVQVYGNEIYNLALLENAVEIKFASIIFNCDNTKFDKYSRLYKSVFENNSEKIKAAINEVLQEKEIHHENILEKLTIVPQLMSYQEVFKTYQLPENVRSFYSCVNDRNIDF